MVMWVWLYQNLCLQNLDIDIYRYCRLSIKISVDSIYHPPITTSWWSPLSEDKTISPTEPRSHIRQLCSNCLQC